MTSQNHSPDTLTSMPRSWYDVPESAAAIFSTRNQTLQKRRLVDPLPPPVIRSELLVDVQNKAALLRHQFPDLILQVRTPQTWNDLYRYFDGVDLWTETPTFLFHVITSISNTNKAIEHEQSVMIDIFGAEWVASNEELVAHTPDSKDVATLFTQAEWDYETSGMNDQELITLRKALNFYAQIPRQKLRQAESRRLQNYLIAPSHHMSSLQVYHTLGPALPAAREQAYPVPPQVHAYPAVAKPHAVIDKTPITERPDLCRNQTASSQPIHPPAQSYDRFMENQRQIAAVNLGPTPINPPDNTGNAAWQNRPRGWSNETSRNSRGPLRHYGRYGNHHQNQHFSHYNDRRTMPNTPRSSSPRQGSSADPIYVLQPQRSSPPYHQNHIRGQRTASQPLPQNLRRIFSDSSTDSTGFPNDPRVKDSVATQAKTQNPQVSSIQLNIPFEGNPQASFNPVNNVSSFFYRGEPRKIQYDDESRRTVYVSGIEVRQFISHAFKEMMSECGEVDYISYLLGRTNNSGPAFVSFMDESSAELAIRRFNNHRLPSGRTLVVNYPQGRRDRSNSHSSQSQRGFAGNFSNYPPPRDNDSRPGYRRYSLRNNSISYRQFNNPAKSTASSSIAQSPPRSPLTIGFQSQLGPVQHSFVTGQGSIESMQFIPAKQLQSSISEVLQHESALNRICQQMPLENVGNYSNAAKKSVNIDNAGFKNSFDPSDSGEETRFGTPTRQRESRPGAYNRKENSPMKASARDGTPLTTPRKQSGIHASANNLKGTGAKSKKKALKQNTSARPSPTGTPLKSRSEANLSITAIGDHVVTSMSAESSAVHDPKNAASFIRDENLNISKDEATTGALDYSSLAIAPVSEPAKADAPATGEESISKKKQQGKKKNKKSTSKSESEEISSRTETFSDLVDVASPTTTESTEYLVSQNTNISFSNSSSHSSSRKPSLASGISDTSLSTTSAPQQQKGDGDSSFCCNTAEEDTNFNMNSTPLHIKSNSNASFSNRSTPKLRSASGKQRQHNHTKKHSTASTVSNGSVRKADSKASKADQNTTTLGSKSTIGETSSIANNTSTIMEGSESSKGKKELDKDILTPTKSTKGSAVSVSDSRKENKHPISPGILDDPSQWPALGPAKSPLSCIADGKPPPQVPIALPLAQRVASSGKPIVPALPLIKTRRPS